LRMENDQVDSRTASFEARRAQLVAIAYRMLGSRAEAEDVVQDVWLKWSVADPDELRSPAAWLTTVATRLSIDRLRHRRAERAAHEAGGGLEPWREAYAPSAEQLALQAAHLSDGVRLLLDRLKPDERAAFVLHQALDCDYAEIARILAKTPAHCRQIVHRAKERLQRAGEPTRPADSATHALMVERLRAAIDMQDRIGLVRLFGETVDLSHDHETASASISTQAAASVVMSVTAMHDEFAREAPQVEILATGDVAQVVLLWNGEIGGLLDLRVDNGRIVALRIVTDAIGLRALNRTFGLPALARRLERIRRRRGTNRSVTVYGDFPVDIDAEYLQAA
jgi:RNA polymerase sigma factor (sigma-70 family)